MRIITVAFLMGMFLFAMDAQAEDFCRDTGTPTYVVKIRGHEKQFIYNCFTCKIKLSTDRRDFRLIEKLGGKDYTVLFVPRENLLAYRRVCR